MKRINTIIGINQNYELSQNELFVNLKYPSKTIKILSLDGLTTFNELNYLAYDIDITNHFAFFTLENESKSYSYDKITRTVDELPYILHIKGLRNKDKYLCFSDYKENEVFLIIDLKTTKVVAEIDSSIGFGNIQIFQNESILSTRKRQGRIGKFDFKNKQLWLLDLSDKCSYDVGNGLEKAQLSNVYADDEFIYILAGVSVVKITIQSGEIVWHTKLNTTQSRGLIHEDYLYTTSNAYINKIDRQTGQTLYQESLDYVYVDGEKTLGPIKELVWYRDSIWTIMDSNPSALIEINPVDGSYKSVVPLKKLGIALDCHMPRFHKNRMYILDFDGTLHIFEMENDTR